MFAWSNVFLCSLASSHSSLGIALVVRRDIFLTLKLGPIAYWYRYCQVNKYGCGKLHPVSPLTDSKKFTRFALLATKMVSKDEITGD